jgi:hypothetical protein
MSEANGCITDAAIYTKVLELLARFGEDNVKIGDLKFFESDNFITFKVTFNATYFGDFGNKHTVSVDFYVMCHVSDGKVSFFDISNYCMCTSCSSKKAIPYTYCNGNQLAYSPYYTHPLDIEFEKIVSFIFTNLSKLFGEEIVLTVGEEKLNSLFEESLKRINCEICKMPMVNDPKNDWLMDIFNGANGRKNENNSTV